MCHPLEPAVQKWLLKMIVCLIQAVSPHRQGAAHHNGKVTIYRAGNARSSSCRTSGRAISRCGGGFWGKGNDRRLMTMQSGFRYPMRLRHRSS
jgi:hypothetical protein